MIAETLESLGSAAVGLLSTQAANLETKLGINTQMAKIVNESDNTTIVVQFNPAEYSLHEGAEYKSVGDRKNDSPVLNFAGGNISRLKMSLYFSTSGFKASAIDSVLSKFNATTEEEDVSKQVEKLSKLTKIDGDEHYPPPVRFEWGSLIFKCYVKSVTATYTMFAKSGKPLRAKVDIEFYKRPDETENKEDPLQSPDRTKIRVLSEDESLWNIAQKEYGDVGMWRCIAKANGIMDPLEIPVGTVLKVPAI